MAEKDETPNHIKNVVPDDIQAFLKAKGIVAKCPICSSTSWNLPVDGAMVAFPGISISQSGDARTSTSSTAAVTLYCDNCFFIWPLAAVPFTQWLESDRGQGQ